MSESGMQPAETEEAVVTVARSALRLLSPYRWYTNPLPMSKQAVEAK